MVYNKSRHLEAAQKFLSQGKISPAIGEYQEILRQEPKDQNALMTIGDLLVRQGDVSNAIEYFQRLAGVFLQDGFTSKAIAIYKKIAKLTPRDTESLERLADLYVQQGVMSEARPIFLQLAELHLKEKRTQQAITVLRQLLEVEPDNVRVRTRLADLYVALGQNEEAAQTYLNSATRALDRSDAAEALKVVERALQIAPNNQRAAVVKARALAATGKAPEAVKILEGLPNLEEDVETTKFLIELFLQTGQTAPAAELARKTFASHPERHPLLYDVAMGLLDGGDAEGALDLLGQIREAMNEAGEPEKLSQALTSVAERLTGRLEPYEWLVELYRQTNDSFRLPEALEQLAQAAASSGKLEQSRQAYQELLEREPGNDHYRRSLNQIRVQLGLVALEEPTAPEVPVIEEAPKPAIAAEQELDEETQHYITQVLTDVDLFSSYGLGQKAITLLESALARAPRHVVILEKLLDLYLGTGDDRRTAELAAQLEQIYTQRGNLANAERFAELRRRFQRAAGLTTGELPAPPPAAPAEEFAIPTVEAEPEPEPAAHEVDLSAEWATLGAGTPEAPPAAPVEAQPEPAPVAGPAPAPPVPEYELELAPAVFPAEKGADATTVSDQFLHELAAEVEELQFAAKETETAPPGPVEEAPSEAPAPVPETAVSPVSPAAQVSQATPASPAAPSEGSVEQLREVFEEFRSELGEMGQEEEDLETHYNLGIAYREMGLLEEAIGEFQRVAKAIQAGRPFRYSMQCYTLLGLAFMDKGEAKIAAMWYQRALDTPGLDQESILALRYDLGVALELAGDLQGALESFRQVYAMNIDYRDVAERIATIGKR